MRRVQTGLGRSASEGGRALLPHLRRLAVRCLSKPMGSESHRGFETRLGRGCVRT